MSAETLLQLVQTLGAPSAILIGALLALRHLHGQLTEVQEKRIADAQLATTKLLEVVHATHEHQATLAKAIDNNADAVRESRILVEHVIADRSIGTLPRIPRRGQ